MNDSSSQNISAVPGESGAYPFLQAPEGIASQSWPDSIRPLVSICCLAYNHAEFIRDALEGFLMQKTTFRVEILIHEDASEDSTAEIVRNYETRYPFLIRTVYQKENQFDKGVDTENDILFPMARGKYIALCEGDDYWTDPYKLQKQVEFMETHPEFALCVSGYTRLHENAKKEQVIIEKNSASTIDNGFVFTLQEMQEKWLTKTLTALFRKRVLNESDLSKYNYRRDIHLFYHLMKNRKGYYFQENFGIYRIHEGGINSMKSGIINKTHAYQCYKELYERNRDEFTRIMCLKSTLSLLNYKFFNSTDYNSYINLYVEAVKLVRNVKDLKWLLTVFIKQTLKERIKEIYR